MITISTQQKSKKRIWKWIVYPLLLLIAAFFIYYLIADSAEGDTDTPTVIFGQRIAPVHTAILEPALSEGDAVMIDEVLADEVVEGDIIAYHSIEKTAGISRVTSIREILGVPYYTVRSATTGESESVPANYLYGTVNRYIPYAGYVMDFMETPWGIVCCIGVPILLAIVLEIISSVRQTKQHLRKKEEDFSEPSLQDWGFEPASIAPPEENSRPSSYSSGSFSPQYAYYPQQNLTGGSFYLDPSALDEGDDAEKSAVPEQRVEEKQPEAQSVDVIPPAPEPETPAPQLNEPAVTPEQPQSAAAPQAQEDKKLSLTLSGDESSEFTVNGINIVYEDDTLNLDVDPSGTPMRIKVRMRDDEAQLLFKTDEKVTRFAILNQEGKPRKISISGKEDEDSNK